MTFKFKRHQLEINLNMNLKDFNSCAGEDWKLLICVRHDLNMSVGKVAAQVGHAVHHAVTNSRWRDLKDWERREPHLCHKSYLKSDIQLAT